MPNRILKDSIWNSPTLAKLDDFTQDQFPRWLLLADDWGCFDVDTETVKGLVYPKRPRVTAKIVKQIRQSFYDAGLLFCWCEGERVWGYWTSWEGHNYCNGSTVEEDGKYSKRRRKTPEPPKELLASYVIDHRPTSSDTVRPFPTSSDKILNPDPDHNPDHNLESSVPNGTLVAYAPASVPKVTTRMLLEIYNAERGGLPECLDLSRDRVKKCEARIRSRARDPDFLDKFTESIRRASSIPFMCGDGERGWKASFDWFIANDTNFQKVLEGKYDGIGKSKAAGRSQRANQAAEQALNDMDASLFGNVSHARERRANPGEDQGVRSYPVGSSAGCP